MADKNTILKLFNTHLFEFMDELVILFPENMDIKASINIFQLTKTANASLLIKIWFNYVESPYGNILREGNLDYFLDKDYKEDLVNLPNASNALRAIDMLRKPVKETSETNKQHSLNYIVNLCKMSAAYNQLTNQNA
jgi:hypothetical protein